MGIINQAVACLIGLVPARGSRCSREKSCSPTAGRLPSPSVPNFLVSVPGAPRTVPRTPQIPLDRSSTSVVRENSHSSLSGDRHRALCPPLLRLLEQTENINRRPCRPRANIFTSSSALRKLT
ncbi:uncharacterized protein BDV14DRAFT_71425 [Aspergillus stella-maris]|uniref:uncharacterized protein n=1 Tax=Aspergillus stella-maris TaxID=1810926 RepID=UPI003CCE1608